LTKTTWTAGEKQSLSCPKGYVRLPFASRKALHTNRSARQAQLGAWIGPFFVAFEIAFRAVAKIEKIFDGL
jgi:hypothetical protein